jgi:hypothetical protein
MNRGRFFAVAELALAALIFVGASVLDVIPINETPWILLLGWISLRLRGRGWRSVGLARPESWGRAVIVAATAAICLQLLSEFVTEPIINQITGQPADLSDFEPIVGNVQLLAVWFVLVWTLAAFGEEMVYRGYILNRAADLGSGTRAAWIVSLVCVSVLFGLGHLYQGPSGVVGSTLSGLLFGGLYLAFRRNLWVPILTHGLSDTIGLLLIFFDKAPGVHR